MVILAVENMDKGMRGEITRWLIEAKAGVFVGNMNPLLREKIWEKVLANIDTQTSALMIYTDNTEQGYSMKMAGTPKRYVVDFEGLSFIATQE
jgi:CRISPR-associated protein Cas2